MSTLDALTISPSPSSFSVTDEDLETGSQNQVAGVGLSDPEVGQTRRKILDLVNRLHNTGVQADIDLPRIAVIGNQSAGKSSLIESISGITLPRASGTCTRCPTECRLSYSEKPWQCDVSLRFTTDVTTGQQLGQAQNIPFGNPIFDRSEVEDRIRRAQRAILNPSTAPDNFLQGRGEDAPKSELSFSSNCVSMKISGPDITDLSFCDLPGLISSVGSGGNTMDISLIKDLVTSYIKQPSCIILLTVACETDFENQGAHHLARQHDQDGERTIGVLTKPDRIPEGDEKSWISFIMNEKDRLKNGWYCVRQPKSTEKGTWEDARDIENQFFGTAPWSELDIIYQRFLRTPNLVQSLSGILSDLISTRLPKIYEQLDFSIEKTLEDLRGLPREPTDDPVGEVMDLIHKFTVDLSRHCEGIPEPDGLLQIIRPAQEQFQRAIEDTKPDFRPFPKGSRKMIDKPGTDRQAGALVTKGGGTAPVFYIDEVMEKAQRARTRELPSNYPFVVQLELIKEATKLWRDPALALCKFVYRTVLDYVKKLVHVHFSSFGRGTLEQRVKVLMQDHIKKCSERAEERITWLLELEERPATQNTPYFSQTRDDLVARFKAEQAKDRNPRLHEAIRSHEAGSSGSQTGVEKVLQSLIELGITNAKASDVSKLLPPDRNDPALEIMADVSAYFQVAYKRFVDFVPNAIDVELVRGIGKDLQRKVSGDLGIHGKNGFQTCQDMAKENQATSNKRADLKKKLERLNGAAQELLSIGQ